MRADLRLSDLTDREVAPTKLMNVKIPDSVSEGIDQVADELSCSKTAAVVALLNEGLSAFATRVKRVVGYRGEITWDSSKPDGTPRKLLDASRMRAMGWSPRTSLESGLQKAYHDFLARFQAG